MSPKAQELKGSLGTRGIFLVVWALRPPKSSKHRVQKWARPAMTQPCCRVSLLDDLRWICHYLYLCIHHPFIQISWIRCSLSDLQGPAVSSPSVFAAADHSFGAWEPSGDSQLPRRAPRLLSAQWRRRRRACATGTPARRRHSAGGRSDVCRPARSLFVDGRGTRRDSCWCVTRFGSSRREAHGRNMRISSLATNMEVDQHCRGKEHGLSQAMPFTCHDCWREVSLVLATF